MIGQRDRTENRALRRTDWHEMVHQRVRPDLIDDRVVAARRKTGAANADVIPPGRQVRRLEVTLRIGHDGRAGRVRGRVLGGNCYIRNDDERARLDRRRSRQIRLVPERRHLDGNVAMDGAPRRGRLGGDVTWNPQDREHRQRQGDCTTWVVFERDTAKTEHRRPSFENRIRQQMRIFPACRAYKKPCRHFSLRGSAA